MQRKKKFDPIGVTIIVSIPLLIFLALVGLAAPLFDDGTMNSTRKTEEQRAADYEQTQSDMDRDISSQALDDAKDKYQADEQSRIMNNMPTYDDSNEPPLIPY